MIYTPLQNDLLVHFMKDKIAGFPKRLSHITQCTIAQNYILNSIFCIVHNMYRLPSTLKIIVSVDDSMVRVNACMVRVNACMVSV